MKNSDLLRIFAQANRTASTLNGEKCYDDYANILERRATVEEATEVSNGEEKA